MEKGEWLVYARRRSVAHYTSDVKPSRSSLTASGARAACASGSLGAHTTQGVGGVVAAEVTPNRGRYGGKPVERRGGEVDHAA